MCSAVPPKPSTHNTRRHHPEQTEDSGAGSRHSSGGLGVEGVDTAAFTAGLALAKRSLGLNLLGNVQPAIGQMLKTETLAGELIAADFKRFRELVTSFTGVQPMQQLLEAERERSRRMVEIMGPSRGLLDSLKIPTPGLQAFTEEISSLQQAALSHTEALQQAAEAMNGGVSRYAEALSSLQIPVRIHAFPASPSTRPATRPSRREEQETTPQNNSALTPTPEGALEAFSKPEDFVAEARAQNLLNILNRFVESEEVSGDVREGLTSAIAWFKINQRRSRRIDGRKLNLLIHAFLRDQHGFETPPEFDQLISSGLLVPRRNGPVAMPELEPEIYTSKQVAERTTYHEGSVRRLADEAWKKASGPAPIQKGSPWWVVAPPKSGDGGRRCGWQFQKQLTASSR